MGFDRCEVLRRTAHWQPTRRTAWPISMKMRFAVNDVTAGGATLPVDWVRLGPYTSPCTFTSRVPLRRRRHVADPDADDVGPHLDDGSPSRRGRANSADPDLTWSGMVGGVGNGDRAVPAARYLQYRATMTSTDGRLTPTIEEGRRRARCRSTKRWSRSR
jgi:hypothetical protein